MLEPFDPIASASSLPVLQKRLRASPMLLAVLRRWSSPMLSGTSQILNPDAVARTDVTLEYEPTVGRDGIDSLIAGAPIPREPTARWGGVALAGAISKKPSDWWSPHFRWHMTMIAPCSRSPNPTGGAPYSPWGMTYRFARYRRRGTGLPSCSHTVPVSPVTFCCRTSSTAATSMRSPAPCRRKRGTAWRRQTMSIG